MKITKNNLKQIIKEELNKLQNEILGEPQRDPNDPSHFPDYEIPKPAPAPKPSPSSIDAKKQFVLTITGKIVNGEALTSQELNLVKAHNLTNLVKELERNAAQFDAMSKFGG